MRLTKNLQVLEVAADRWYHDGSGLIRIVTECNRRPTPTTAAYGTLYQPNPTFEDDPPMPSAARASDPALRVPPALRSV